MIDKTFGYIENGKCPKCGKKKVICIIQHPLIVEVDMQGKPIFRNAEGKRKKVSNRDMAWAFKGAISGEYQCANYNCKACGWISETYTP